MVGSLKFVAKYIKLSQVWYYLYIYFIDKFAIQNTTIIIIIVNTSKNEYITIINFLLIICLLLFIKWDFIGCTFFDNERELRSNQTFCVIGVSNKQFLNISVILPSLSKNAVIIIDSNE